MQPYRQMVLASGAPVTCLDPPRSPPCDGARPARGPRRTLAWLAPALLVALAAAQALVLLAEPWANAGRIEIAPEALARRAHRAPASPPRAVLPPPAPSPPEEPRALVSWFDLGEHDPSKLAASARKLQAMGVDITVADVEIARSTVDSFDSFGYWPTAIGLPNNVHRDRLVAIDLGDLPDDSPALATGVQKHDVLLSIDGYRVDDWRARDVERIRGRGSLALELDRRGRRVLLLVHWRTKRGPA